MYEQRRHQAQKPNGQMAQAARRQRGPHLRGHSRTVPSNQTRNHNAARFWTAVGAEPSTHAEQLSQGYTYAQNTREDHARAMLQSNEHCQASTTQVREVSQGTQVRQQIMSRPRVSRSSKNGTNAGCNMTANDPAL